MDGSPLHASDRPVPVPPPDLLVSEPITLLDDSTAHHGFPGLCRTPSDRLVAAFRRGSTHLSYDGDIMTMHSCDLGLTWSEPHCVRPAHNGDDFRDPSLTLLSDGTLMMVFFRRQDGGGTAVHTYAMRSADEGEQWDEPVMVGALPCSAPVVELPAGELVQPLYGDTAAVLHHSLDGGRTWQPKSVIIDAAEVLREPWVVHTGGGTLVALVRNDTDQLTRRLVSADGGTHWSAPVHAFRSRSRVSWLKASTGHGHAFFRGAGDVRDLIVRSSATDFATWTDATVVHSAGEGGRNAYACPVEVASGTYAVIISQENSHSCAALYIVYATESPPPP